MIDYARNVQSSSLSIYDLIDPDDNSLFIPTYENILLDTPLRTRSKVVKSLICEALGYPIPRSFKKTQPRFPGQNFDVYTQKSLNVQIWNEDVDATRRYVFLQIDEDDGTYPDIANQLLEIKLQTSPTIVLGLHSPEDGASIVKIGNTTFNSEDVRYVIFDGSVNGSHITLDRLYLVFLYS